LEVVKTVGKGNKVLTDEELKSKKWLTVKEAIQYSGLCRSSFHKWIREGKLPFSTYLPAPRMRKILRHDIDVWLESCRREAGTGPVYPRKRKKKEGGTNVKQLTEVGSGGLASHAIRSPDATAGA
jgi:predicted DNA-binding transcriptional regulator AlpA